MRASKALGRRHDDSEEEASDPEIASESEGEGAGGPDPFFQHDADVFNDPFFTAVRPKPYIGIINPESLFPAQRGRPQRPAVRPAACRSSGRSFLCY